MYALPLALLVAFPWPSDRPQFDRKEDVIYGRKFGMCLTMDVYVPKAKKNGAGIIWCVSGGWFSSKQTQPPRTYDEFLRRGYVVFAVYHGSQPRFSIPEVLEDMHRATRFVRRNARKYGVDPERLGIAGGSAGGHLSLMQGMAPKEGDPTSLDRVERESSRVAAVACFFPPTDFLNYGKPGVEAIGNNILKGFQAPFDFVALDPETRSFKPITDPAKRRQIAKQISPAYHVTPKAPPTLIFHGDADTLVPIQQSELIVKELKEAKVPCELVVKKGAGHGWPDLLKDVNVLADWFDKYLGKR
jgi:acetyl esterase/lipase